MGLAELIEFVLKGYDEKTATLLCKNVCITGGLANIAGFKERIFSEITMIRPFK